MTAVTLLTSLDYASAQELGISVLLRISSPDGQLLRSTLVPARWCARPHEVARLRAIVPSEVHLITRESGRRGPARTISAAHRHRRKRSPTDRISWSSDAPSPESQTQQKR